LKHPWFEGHTYNPAENMKLAASGSNPNIGTIENPSSATNAIGSGGKVPGSRAMRIESRKGILSRKSSVNKNSFYKQKTKDSQPNKLYGVASPGGISGMGTIGSGANRGPSSYFNKNGGPMGSSGGYSGLPNVNPNSRGAPAIQKTYGSGS
jgi:hypothetical protein